MFIFLNSIIYSFPNLNSHNLIIIIANKESKYNFEMIYRCYCCKNEFLSGRLLINNINETTTRPILVQLCNGQIFIKLDSEDIEVGSSNFTNALDIYFKVSVL